MAWVDIPVTKTNYDGPYSSTVTGKVFTILQYDDTTVTTTSVKVRFKLHCDPVTNYWDEYHVMLNPNKSNRSLHLLKSDYTNPNKTSWTLAKAKAKWPYVSSTTFTLTKSATAEKFTIPEFWIMNDGQHNSNHTVDSFYETFTDTYRKSYKSAHASTTLTADNSVVVITPVGKGTISITDNYNNTFTVKGTKGAAGENNPSSGPTITWGYTSSYGNSGAVSSKALAITEPELATKKVYAKCVTGAKYGSDTTVTTTADIKQYVGPQKAGTPEISYTRSRLTIKEAWSFSWGAAKATNSSSPIKGYRIRLYKNGSLVKGLGASGNNLTLTSGTNEWIDREGTSTNVIIPDPAAFGFKAGDTVQLSVQAYTRYSASNTGNQLFNNNTGSASSAEYTVKNAGIVYTKVAGSWKEGQVYVKVDGSWREAETVNVKVNGAWKESQ